MTKYSNITADQVLDQIKTIAAENPDHVYEAPADLATDLGRCLYVHYDEPGCIVGKALFDLGVSLGDLTTFGDDARLGGGAPAESLLKELGIIGCLDSASGRIQSIQSRQDRGIPWGEAVEGAITGDDEE